MAEYENAVEGSLLAEEEVVEQAEAAGEAPERGHFHQYLSFYIAGISMVVAIAALLTALAADQSMDESLANLGDVVERNGLRIELRYHEIQRDIAQIAGGRSAADSQTAIADVGRQLSKLESESRTLGREAQHTLKAHYVLAVGITLLQVATALAATVGITRTHHLLIPSGLFACGGICITLLGVVDYLA